MNYFMLLALFVLLICIYACMHEAIKLQVLFRLLTVSGPVCAIYMYTHGKVHASKASSIFFLKIMIIVHNYYPHIATSVLCTICT